MTSVAMRIADSMMRSKTLCETLDFTEREDLTCLIEQWANYAYKEAGFFDRQTISRFLPRQMKMCLKSDSLDLPEE
jgi:hypothetical protein